MQASRFRFEVILERRVDTQDAAGQVVHTYTEFARDFASVEDLSQREAAVIAQIAAEATTRIRMRFRNDIDETCRIRQIVDFDSPTVERIFDILGPPTVDAKTGRREISLLCAERRADGWRRGEA